MGLFSCFILFSFVLADIWQKSKFISINLIKYVSSFLPYFSYLVLMLHINILLSFHSRHIFESIIFNIEDNVWFRFGGMYINFYLFVLFGFVLFCLVVLKKLKKFPSGLCFEFVILLLLKEFHCFHAQFIAHARSHSNTTSCWRIKMIRKS